MFLLDQYQVVRPGEMGTVADITAAAAARGIDVMHVSLDDQFRCGESLAYVQWVERLLGLAPGKPVSYAGDDGFEVFMASSPAELEAWLRAQHEQGYGTRLTAGYCWPWSDPRRDGTLVPDVRIGDWERPWNLKGGQVRRRRAAVGEGPGRVRAGGVHLHGAGLRIRLRRRDHRAGLGVA